MSAQEVNGSMPNKLFIGLIKSNRGRKMLSSQLNHKQGCPRGYCYYVKFRLTESSE